MQQNWVGMKRISLRALITTSGFGSIVFLLMQMCMVTFGEIETFHALGTKVLKNAIERRVTGGFHLMEFPEKLLELASGFGSLCNDANVFDDF